jgi:hypothetical protein
MVDVADAAVVAILTRAPGHGGKSRLFAELRRPFDPALLTALLLDTLDGSAVDGAARVVAVEPPQACDEIRALVPGDIAIVPQTSGTLGDRMRDLMQALFDGGARSVVLVGSDLPDIDPGVVADALARLEQDRDVLVLGPASDGGYYLIGAGRTAPPVFEAIDWSTADVLSQTRVKAEQHGMRVALLAPLADVDSAADLARVMAGRTRAWVSANLRQE